MAYNQKKNEVTEVMTDVTKNNRGDVVRVSKITSDGDVSYDIRNMFVAESGELQFTTKGVRLKESDMAAVIIEVMKSLDTDTYNSIIDGISQTE